MNAERRKRIQEAFDALQMAAEEEREAYDNTPESLQGTDRGMQMEAAADALDEACSAIETALE